MLRAIGQTISRIIIIGMAAAVVAGGIYALSRSPIATAIGRGPGPGGAERQRNFPAPANGSAVSPNPATPSFGAPPNGQDFGGPPNDRNRNQPSLTRGLPDLVTNIVVIGLLIWGVFLTQNWMKRRQRQRRAVG